MSKRIQKLKKTGNSEVKNKYNAIDPKYISISKEMTLDGNDLFLVGDLELSKKGLINHHIESMNELYEIGIDQIITKVFKIEKDIDKDYL